MLSFWEAKRSAAPETPEVQGTKWIMGEVERGDGEEEDGGREKSRSPLGCSCQGSGEADIIHLIGSYRLSEGFFLFYWAKGSECRAPSMLLSQQTLQLAFFCSPSSLRFYSSYISVLLRDLSLNGAFNTGSVFI